MIATGFVINGNILLIFIVLVKLYSLGYKNVLCYMSSFDHIWMDTCLHILDH